MEGRRWYEADALMPDLTAHRHSMRDLSEEGVERRMRAHYPEAVVILVLSREEEQATAVEELR